MCLNEAEIYTKPGNMSMIIVSFWFTFAMAARFVDSETSIDALTEDTSLENDENEALASTNETLPWANKRRRTRTEKLEHGRKEHPMFEPCKPCHRNCIASITQRRRVQIYLQFWDVSYNEQKNFIHRAVDVQEANKTKFATRNRDVSSQIYASLSYLQLEFNDSQRNLA